MDYSKWARDLDEVSVTWPRGGKSSSILKTKGRCTRCWGALNAWGDAKGGCTAIRCRVCGAGVSGLTAAEELGRMEAEMASNLHRADLGAVSADRTGQFTFKIFPDVDRRSFEQVKSRPESRKQRSRRNWMTRTEFPFGSAGWLVFQARALLAGIEYRAVWDERSFAGFAEFDTGDDGSLFVPDTPASHTELGQSKEGSVLKWMGATMTATMNSAFACELALKAIALTCNDQARKKHDLLVLLNDLPDICRSRMQADHKEMASLFERKRHAYGAWRYFERDAGDGGIKSLVDISAARDLGRAARVLLDEAEVVGLRASFAFEGTRMSEDTDRGRLHRDYIKIRLTGGESPPAL